MKDEDVITRLVDLHDHIQAPVVSTRDDALRGRRLVRRRNTTLVAVGASVTAMVLLGAGILQGALSEDQRDLQPAPAPSPSLLPPSQSTEAPPSSGDAFASELRQIVAQVPDWSIDDTQPMFTATPCAGDWSSEAVGSGGGSVDVSTNGVQGQVWHTLMGFRSSADASAAVDALAENLESCTTVVWQAEQIGRTGAVLATSADGLVWLHHAGQELSYLEAATTDGPPPLDVQVAIADLLLSDMTR